MAQSNAILIAGTGARSEDIADTASTMGLVPFIRDGMMQALTTLSHDRFAAVFVDGEAIGADAIEFLLNVRDIDNAVPVVVIDEHLGRQESGVLKQQRHTFLLSDTTGVSQLLQTILH